jgi:hypothetical protein
MRFSVAVIFLISLLSSCASQIMRSYVGKNINEAILDYGQPANIVELAKNQRAFQWQISNSYTTPTTLRTSGSSSNTATLHANTNTANIYGNTAYSDTTYITPGQTYQDSCLYTLIADKQENSWIVTSYRKPRFMCE